MCIIYKSNSTPSIPALWASSNSTRLAHLPPRMPRGYLFTLRWTCSVSSSVIPVKSVPFASHGPHHALPAPELSSIVHRTVYFVRDELRRLDLNGIRCAERTGSQRKDTRKMGITEEDVFHWWMEDGVLPGQIDMEDLFRETDNSNDAEGWR